MKKLTVFFSILLCLGFFGVQAQDKETLKRWKSKQKSMSVEDFMRIMQEYETAKTDVDALKRSIPGAAKAKAEKEAEVAELKRKIEEAEKNPSKASSNSKSEDFSKGVTFRVQIGAFKTKNLDVEVLQQRFKVEEDADGNKKYTVGIFRDYWDADLFKNYLCSMGIKDAWITCYKDDARLTIQEVFSEKEIEAIKAQKKNPEYQKMKCGSGGDDF